jgi:hypothetical protein
LLIPNQEEIVMGFTKNILGLSVAAVLAISSVGCGGVESEEETGSSEDELRGEDVLCTFVPCEWDQEDHGGGGSGSFGGGGGGGGRWVRIGVENTDGIYDHDRFDVRANQRFSQIQLRIRDGGVNIHDLDVHFRDGSSFSPDFKRHYREGERSRIEWIPGGPRRIESVDITHSKDIFGTGSNVEFWVKR